VRNIFNLSTAEFGRDRMRLQPGDLVRLDRNVIVRLEYVGTTDGAADQDGRVTLRLHPDAGLECDV
jgi:hypothetical protein